MKIADDIEAILVIAIGYTEEIYLGFLGLGFAGVVVTWIMERVGVRSIGPYTLVGNSIRLGFHESGVHATVAGVVLGLMTPASNRVSQEVIARGAERIAEIMRGDDWVNMSHRVEKVRTVKWAARESVSPLEYLESLPHP